MLEYDLTQKLHGWHLSHVGLNFFILARVYSTCRYQDIITFFICSYYKCDSFSFSFPPCRHRSSSKEILSPSIVTWWLDLGVGNSVRWILRTLFQIMKAQFIFGKAMKIGLCQLCCNAILSINFHGFNTTSYQVLDTYFHSLLGWTKLLQRHFYLGRSSLFFLCQLAVFFPLFCLFVSLILFFTLYVL